MCLHVTHFQGTLMITVTGIFGTLLIPLSLLSPAELAPTDSPLRSSDSQGPVGQAGVADLKLWYAQPASRWLDSVPVGNGRLGAMVFGGMECERLALNESTVWSGKPSDRHENPAALQHLPRIRALMFEGKFAQAVGLCRSWLLGRTDTYGTHLPVGDLWLRINHGGAAVGDYRRELDIDEGIARVGYMAGGARYTREVLASNPDDVLVVRLTCDAPGRLTLEARYDGGSNRSEVKVQGQDTLVFTGRAVEKKHSDGRSGVTFVGLVRILPEGGRLCATANSITLERADAATVLVALHTDYRGGDPAALCRERVDAAAKKPYLQLRRSHVADHERLFRRVALDLGRTEAAGLPTDRRLAAVRAGGDDPQLAALFFQYGRYLMIAGSRENSPLPMNLQGLWNDNLACNMGWTCDFHMDINTQMNYWPAEVCNLSECHRPLLDLIESLREPGRRTAKMVYGCRGWVCHVFTNAWGFTAPGWGLGWGIHPTGGIWLASHLWEHYAFTGDREFLAKRAYPTLKEAAEFFLEYMVEHPRHGWLVTGPATSPENSFIAPDGRAYSESMGPTCDRVLVYDLFTQCIEAAQTLGVDSEFRSRLDKARAKLPPLKVGRHGQLQEWLEDYEEAIPNHRHTTHLIALYPSDQITPRRTPPLAKAARVTIERRTSRPDWEDVEWSRANMINFYARLGDGEQARQSVLMLLKKLTDTNLLTYSVAGIAGAQDNIFVIDGNTGATAGIAEMLLQSHGGEINLLPALPKAWQIGSVRGLRARDGFEVDIRWKDGRLDAAAVRSVTGNGGRVRYGDKLVELSLKPGQKAELNGNLDMR